MTPTQKPRIKRDYSQLLDCYVFVCTGIGQVGFGPQWTAVHNLRLGHCYYGPTPLIAICHCYVASKLGDEVDVPEELLCPSPLTNSAS